MSVLPAHPSLEHLRKQAKRRRRERAIPLHRAQHELAHEYGFTELDAAGPRMSRWATLTGRERALVLADPAALAPLLAAAPAAATDPIATLPPLLALLRRGLGSPAEVRECAALLLAAGADADSRTVESGGEWRQTALFDAVERRDLTLVRLLLGARCHPRRGRLLPRMRAVRPRLPRRALRARVRADGAAQARLRGRCRAALVPRSRRRRRRGALSALGDRARPRRGDPAVAVRRGRRRRSCRPAPVTTPDTGPSRSPPAVVTSPPTSCCGRTAPPPSSTRSTRQCWPSPAVGPPGSRRRPRRCPAVPNNNGSGWLLGQFALLGRTDVVRAHAGCRDGRRHPGLEQLHPARPGRHARPRRAPCGCSSNAAPTSPTARSTTRDPTPLDCALWGLRNNRADRRRLPRHRCDPGRRGRADPARAPPTGDPRRRRHAVRLRLTPAARRPTGARPAVAGGCMPADSHPGPAARPSSRNRPQFAAAFLDRLRTALHEVGFLQLTDYGAAPGQVEELTAAADRFFALPLADRLALDNRRSPHFRGYTRLGHEITAGRPDAREQLDFAPERPAVPRAAWDAPFRLLEGPNQWPDAAAARAAPRRAGLGGAARPGRGRADRGHRRRRWGWPRTTSCRRSPSEPHWFGKLIRYVGTRRRRPGRAGRRPARRLGLPDPAAAGRHRRSAGPAAAGPAVGRTSRRYPDALVINVGEMLEVATHGYLVSTVHRVLPCPPGRTRQSDRVLLVAAAGRRRCTRCRSPPSWPRSRPASPRPSTTRCCPASATTRSRAGSARTPRSPSATTPICSAALARRGAAGARAYDPASSGHLRRRPVARARPRPPRPRPRRAPPRPPARRTGPPAPGPAGPRCSAPPAAARPGPAPAPTPRTARPPAPRRTPRTRGPGLRPAPRPAPPGR